MAAQVLFHRLTIAAQVRAQLRVVKLGVPAVSNNQHRFGPLEPGREMLLRLGGGADERGIALWSEAAEFADQLVDGFGGGVPLHLFPLRGDVAAVALRAKGQESYLDPLGHLHQGFFEGGQRLVFATLLGARRLGNRVHTARVVEHDYHLVVAGVEAFVLARLRLDDH